MSLPLSQSLPTGFLALSSFVAFAGVVVFVAFVAFVTVRVCWVAVALAGVAARDGGVYATHIRDELDAILPALLEAAVKKIGADYDRWAYTQTVPERDAKGKTRTIQTYRASNTFAVFVKPVEKAGDVILSGSQSPLVPVKAGDSLHCSVGGLGSTSVRFMNKERSLSVRTFSGAMGW